MLFSDADQRHMARALALAEHGLFGTTPNPRVGCVLVGDGEVLAEGWHARAGGPHAEAAAIAEANARGVNLRGATAYVTLEPCNHQGRTPPCAHALIEAGVTRVVIAMADPNPTAAGGIQALREAGITVECGLLQAEAEALNPGFISRVTRQRPWVRMKIAASLDGRTALADGRSQWITGAAARQDGHQWRARACAILTGIGTVRDDDPQLNVRDIDTPRQPLRVVIDSRLETPLQARILQGSKTLLLSAIDDPAREAAYAVRGVEVERVPSNAQGKTDLPLVLEALARRGINELHVEAGAKLNGSLLREGCVDELLIYLAPSVIGDTGLGMFALPPLAELAAQQRLQFTDVRQIGDDLRILARVQRASAGWPSV
jgi:diaminohydroxyphosphoribosylaminopyrimidine deaminase/5-amino-6-(5-phosphoribosylamino)uracil reductase